jgi:hypothetical protein
MPTGRCGFRSTSLAQPRSKRIATALDVVRRIARMSVSALRFHRSMPTLWSRAPDQTWADANVCPTPIADGSGCRIDQRSHESVINTKVPRFLVSGRKSVLNQTPRQGYSSFGRSQYPTSRPRANRTPFRREYSDSAVHCGRRRCCHPPGHEPWQARLRSACRARFRKDGCHARGERVHDGVTLAKRHA